MAKTRTSRGGRVIMGLTPRFFRLWDQLPYGVWTTTTGRQVLFTRFYEPLYQREPGGDVTEADPKEWVTVIAEARWFYVASHAERTIQVAETALALWREGRLEEIPTTTIRRGKAPAP